VKATGLVQSPVEKKIACPAPMVEKACAVVGKQRACGGSSKSSLKGKWWRLGLGEKKIKHNLSLYHVINSTYIDIRTLDSNSYMYRLGEKTKPNLGSYHVMNNTCINMRS
jgi:hypothetical protein